MDWIEVFLAELADQERSSPSGKYWDLFRKFLIAQGGFDTKDKLLNPLILGGAIGSDRDKHDRLRSQLQWAQRHQCLTQAIEFLRKLGPHCWNHAPIDRWEHTHHWLEFNLTAVSRYETTQLAVDLIQAYCKTWFHVEGQRPFVLHIGEESQDLVDLHGEKGVSSSAFISACNPYSQKFSEKQNQERQLQLADELVDLGVEFIKGYGQDPSGEWGKEDSFLIIGLSLDQAMEIGVRWEQNAIVWLKDGHCAQLVLLR